MVTCPRPGHPTGMHAGSSALKFDMFPPAGSALGPNGESSHVATNTRTFLSLFQDNVSTRLRDLVSYALCAV